MGKRRAVKGKPNKFLEDADRKSDIFWSYYQGQFGWSEVEASLCKQAFDQELPATFRVTGFRRQSQEVLRLIKNKFLEGLIGTKVSSEITDPHDSNMMNPELCKLGASLATPLPWYPNKMAWQLNSTKVEIRKSAELKKVHRFLISETDCGFMSRQEAVSMIPPLLLEIESHHKILDLCAAPGSKTAQLLEMLHSNCDSVPTGVVVANDIDIKRCYTMVHQLQRLQSPCVVVVRQDASIFPKMYLPNSSSKSGQSPMQFDRILADVPCSGDGTLRKNPDLWARWTPMLGVNEHFIQTKILRRSLEMLAVGGRMVYSTCSLNPIEDEAVIAAVLTQSHESVTLVDIREKLPGLISTPGLSSWKVMLKDKSWCSCVEDVPMDQKRSFRATLFPPKNVEELHLERCRRVFPHLQNTGGFFVALFEKVSCLPWMNAMKSTQIMHHVEEDKKEVSLGTEDKEVVTEEKSLEGKEAVIEENTEGEAVMIKEDKQKVHPLHGTHTNKNARVFKEEPFYYLEDEDDSWKNIQKYYHISDSFPHRQLMYRNADGKRRNYYFTNDLVKRLVQMNMGGGINFVNLGVKTFGINDDKVFQGYRLLQEGLEIVEPFVGSLGRRMSLPCRADLVNLLTQETPLISTFSDMLINQLSNLSVGPILFQYNPEEDSSRTDMPRIPLVLAGWKGFNSIRHYVGVHERSHLLRLCGEEEEDEDEKMVEKKDIEDEKPKEYEIEVLEKRMKMDEEVEGSKTNSLEVETKENELCT